MRLNLFFFGLSVAALVILVYPLSADSGDRQWVVDQRGERVGYLEPGPYGSGNLILRDRDGNYVGHIEEDAVDNGHVIRDRHGARLGRLEGWQDERRERKDWRDGPLKRWGSYEDRWAR
jgi:hypothetical protein